MEFVETSLDDKAAAALIRRNLQSLLVHFACPGLDRDNKVEGVANQLREKIKLKRGFKKSCNACAYVALICPWYKFKRFEASTHKERNGRSPSELAGCTVGRQDWIEFCFKVK